jgi:hypothetical protein
MPGKKRLAKEKRERNGRVLAFFGSACALGEWWYNVNNPEPSDLFSGALLLGFCAFSLVATWEFFDFRFGGRVGSFALATIAFFLLFRLSGEWRGAHQRAEVWQHLTVSVPSGAIDYDPMVTNFTVTNGSAFTISKLHGVTCYTNAAVGNEDSAQRGAYSWKDERGGSGLTFGPLTDPAPLMATFDQGMKHSPIGPGGDAQTDRCMEWFQFTTGTICADITLIFWYALQSQPDLREEKRFRLVGERPDRGKFEWSQRTVEAPGNYCERYKKWD